MVAAFSIQYILLSIFYCLRMVLYCNSYQFNFYHTEHQLHKLSRNCLYYFLVEHVTVPQFIPYCMGTSPDEIQSTKSPHYDRSFTFEQLHKLNISSHQLYIWSAPIDLIESYQIFLDKHLLVDDLIFYNCTYPWFGTYCEYSFDRTRSHLSFADQIQLSFLEKGMFVNYISENLPCYTHLDCDRTGDHGRVSGACLDWREVCDGKINCLNGQNDEEHCWQLEINECDPETEFRCHNGLCIPLSFLNDDIHNPDCLDRSDEYIYELSREVNAMDASRLIPSNCHMNPAFKCEEHSRRSPQRGQIYIHGTLECGDGLSTDKSTDGCRNGRDRLLLKATIAGANASDQCRLAFDCVIGYYLIYNSYDSEYYGDCQFDNDKYVTILQQDCPPLIELGPIMNGVVRFVYHNNVSKVSENE